MSRGSDSLALVMATLAMIAVLWSLPASAQPVCQGYGPQSPRDITNTGGANRRIWSLAPPPERLNLCNIHAHVNAEHLGPGFFLHPRPGEAGGWRCHGSEELSAAELDDPTRGQGAFRGVRPGDTIEVHWVYTSCNVQPGEGLGSCHSDTCANPTLRVEAQVFLLVNDPEAADFLDYAYRGHRRTGYHQPRSLPDSELAPVVYRGSMSGPSYSRETCSPSQVTWSVRPACKKLDVSSLHRWAEEGNVFNETRAHGVRAIVTTPDILSPIE